MKIGKAVNVSARLSEIGAHIFALPHCLLLHFCNEQAAFRAESILQRTFAHWRIDAASVNGGQKGRSGDTEWFDIACRDRLDQFLLANMDLLEAELVQQEGIAQVLEALTRPRLVARSVRKTRPANRSVENTDPRLELLDEEVEVLGRPVIDRVAGGLTELAEMCDWIGLVEKSAHGRCRNVIGSTSVPVDVYADHVHNLMSESVLPIKYYLIGNLRLVQGGSFHSRGSIDFVVRLTLPGATDGRWPQVERLIESLFEYPVPITGWPGPAS
ncbi:GIY-YIG nuclease family protein [Massilia litorea]|uniref:GIY-YIG nuclease family protein n=2 Tax=Massilia litorea TaxID=2769491 RepID=A0A7L9U5S6_9BURK|nr:GIY-YIG nuclease family protein [Massilia litorea]